MGASDPSDAPAFRCSGLTNDHGRGRGVLDADLTVSRGEVSGSVVPNGSGRATTIPLLMDLIRSHRGPASLVGAYGQAYLAVPEVGGPALLARLTVTGGVVASYLAERTKAAGAREQRAPRWREGNNP